MAEEEKRSSRPCDAGGRFLLKDKGRRRNDRRSEPAADDRGQESAEGGDGKRGLEEISDTTAPSIGPHSVVEREPVEVRLARHEQSSVDAMGHDKRRQVVGKTYGPTLARQAGLYGIVLVIAAAISFGIKAAVDHFDQPPDHFKAEAPWAQPGVKQIKPKPLQ